MIKVTISAGVAKTNQQRYRMRKNIDNEFVRLPYFLSKNQRLYIIDAFNKSDSFIQNSFNYRKLMQTYFEEFD